MLMFVGTETHLADLIHLPYQLSAHCHKDGFGKRVICALVPSSVHLLCVCVERIVDRFVLFV